MKLRSQREEVRLAKRSKLSRSKQIVIANRGGSLIRSNRDRLKMCPFRITTSLLKRYSKPIGRLLQLSKERESIPEILEMIVNCHISRDISLNCIELKETAINALNQS